MWGGKEDKHKEVSEVWTGGREGGRDGRGGEERDEESEERCEV